MKKQFSIQIKNIIKKLFYIIFDESPERRGRKIVNVLIGELIPEQANKPILFNTVEFENVNSEEISRQINLICKRFLSIQKIA